MRILSLSTCPLDPLLGSGKTRLRWSQGLRSLGHTVDIFEPKDYETWQGARRALRFRQAWGACGFVKEKLRATDYDIIEFFGGEFGLATWQLSKLKTRPLIVAHTDGLELLASDRERAYNPPASIKSRLRALFSRYTHEPLSRAAFIYADAFVTGSRLDLDYVLDRGIYSPERGAVVAPGLDKEYLSNSFTTRKQDRVVFTGSWIERKGVCILARVMSRLLERKPDLHLDINGTGVASDVVLSSFSKTLHERINVRPRVSSEENVASLIKAKVFFFPTQYEGFGMTLAEAMASSCAPVTTRTGFGAELRDGHEALLCDFNDEAAMQRAILALLDDDEMRIRISRAAWERVQPLGWDLQIKKLETFYTRWVSENRSGLYNLPKQDQDRSAIKELRSEHLL
jgi:glycosyltransferase involved in cell wall biosynthesis